MNPPKYFVGFDIAADDFAATIGTYPWRITASPQTFANTLAGFEQMLSWLVQHEATVEQSVCCLEATGVYGEAVAHYLVARNYRVAIEPPLKVKRAFHPTGHKNDPVDSQQIAAYACRFFDELSFWQPPSERIEQIRVLLTTREQLTKETTMHKNALTALKRKVASTPLAERIHTETIQQLQGRQKEIDTEIKRLIDQDDTWRGWKKIILSSPGVGLMLAAHTLVLTDGFTQLFSSKQFSAYLGICPYEYQSGKSVYRPARSRGYGPSAVRRLLHLAARSLAHHHPDFRSYFERKRAEGKPKRLIYNNIENKIVKIMCAVLKSKTPYDRNYRPALASVSTTT